MVRLGRAKFLDEDEGEEEDEAAEGSSEKAEECTLPASEGTDAAKEFDVAFAHGFFSEGGFTEDSSPIDDCRSDGETKEGFDATEDVGTKAGASDAVELGVEDGEQDAHDCTANGEDVRDEHVVEVDEDGGHEAADEKHGADGEGGVCHAVELPGGKEEQAGEKFDDGVADTEFSAAATGFAAEEEPGEDGKVVKPADGFAAGASGLWGDDGPAFGDAVDADVEEAAKAGSGAKEEYLEDPGGFLGEQGEVGHVYGAGLARVMALMSML